MRAATKLVVLSGADLGSRIAAWQNRNTTPIYVAGFDSTFWAANRLHALPDNPTGQATPFTMINPGLSIRQKTTITQIRVDCYYLGNPLADWSFRLFTYDAGNSVYVCKSKCNFRPTGNIGASNTIQTFTLATPLDADIGDIPGLMLPLHHGTYPGIQPGNLTQTNYKIVAGDIDVGQTNAFASGWPWAEDTQLYLHLACFGLTRPYACGLGDSMLSDGNQSVSGTPVQEWVTDQGATNQYHRPGGSPGDINYSVLYRLATRLPVQFRYQDFSKGGSTWATMAATQAARAVAVDPAAIFIHCGVNDVNAGRTWAAVAADMDTVRGLIGTSRTVYLNEILPWVNLDDTKSAALRTMNANYATYAATYGWHLVKCHDEMGQIRAGTGQLDDMIVAYRAGDALHLNAVGVDKLAEIMRRYVR